jgi:protein-S-isoprenylcysteine O-methyltransferase Ste14
MLVASLAFLVIGPLIALWGLLYLGRSFGIFVSVRRVVLQGPYRWIRHPMYLGWACSAFGLALSNFSSAYILIVAVHFVLMLYRARLEEAELREFSPDYREFMKKTGFFLPKIRPIRFAAKSATTPLQTISAKTGISAHLPADVQQT